ncbi:MAG: GNAT family N-acetyltransferase [Bacteroidetes bacterium]|nr:GNAT family N-acetyltransferase [Bacteroidota bacterium]MBS1973898.1 GNAT family N-acetyltransferase [Bacteroidota bacterium]
MKAQIRPWKNEDAKALAYAANSDKIGATLRDGFPFPYTKEDAEQWLSFNIGKEPVTNFAILATGQIVGGIGFLLKDNIYRKNAEIGYWLAEPFWNRGIATEAVRLLINHIFSGFDIDRIYAEVFSNNPASMKVLEKNGFQLDAIHRKSIIKGNHILDAYHWAKLREGL